MAETKLRHRAFALSLAALFLFTAVATSAAVVWSIYSSNQANKKANSKQASSTKLAGTKLTGFTPISHIPTLQEIDTKTGTGAVATANSTVSVLYTGAVAATGIIFQSSLDNGPSPVTFPLTNVIKGWQQGIPGMRVGGERRLLIPAALAYGATPPAESNIPANADLVFDVTLLSVK